MMMDVTKISILRIEVAEKELQICESKLDKIERRIRITDLSKDQLASLQNEEKELKAEQKKYVAKLQTLRKENGKNTFISFVILGIIALVYYTFFAS